MSANGSPCKRPVENLNCMREVRFLINALNPKVYFPEPIKEPGWVVVENPKYSEICVIDCWKTPGGFFTMANLDAIVIVSSDELPTRIDVKPANISTGKHVHKSVEPEPFEEWLFVIPKTR